MSGVTGGHHVLSIKHLLGELGHGDGPVMLASPGGQRGKARHEKVEPGEWDHVDSEFPQVSIQLSREPEAGGDSRHGEGHQVVEVTVGGGGELQGAEANVVESLIVNAVGLISVLDKLVH